MATSQSGDLDPSKRKRPRALNRLAPVQVKSLGRGMHADGGGLYLRVSGDAGRSWIFRYAERGAPKLRLIDMGLGSVATISLKEARNLALEMRKILHAGRDPLTERAKEKQALALEKAKRLTFGECAESYIEAHRAGWRNDKHVNQWRNTLKTHAALLYDLPVGEIETDSVVRVLERIWRTRTETASRVRQRIEAVLDWATVRHFRKGDNPARWHGHLSELLPAPSKIAKAQHHAAIPWQDMPAFMAELRERNSLSAIALELIVLTACRVSELVAATWDEFDLDGAVWTVPAARMKAGREHRVALCARAVKLLRQLPRESDFVLPGSKPRTHFNAESPRAFLQRDLGKTGITAHGFRSSFRDWAAETTGFGSEVVEMALAHTVKNKVEAAYRRGDLFAKRAKLMQAWDDYLSQRKSAASVAPINAPAASRRRSV